MRLRTLLRTVCVLNLFAAISATNPAQACQCPFVGTRASEFLKPEILVKVRKAPDAALFVGRVVALIQWVDWQPTSSTFQVLKVLAGELPNTLTLWGISSEDTSCGMNLHLTQIGLFYIYRNAEGEWTTSVCSQPIPDMTPAALHQLATQP